MTIFINLVLQETKYLHLDAYFKFKSKKKNFSMLFNSLNSD